MSLKPRAIDGLNYVYDSGPQMTYADGSKHSRWTLIVDSSFMKRFGDAAVPLEVLREADSLQFQLPNEALNRVVRWGSGVASRVRRIYSRESTSSLLDLGVQEFEGISQINAHAVALQGLHLSDYLNLSLLNLIDVSDPKLLADCENLAELLLWKTDLRKTGLSWSKGCSKLNRISLVECKGWSSQSSDESFVAEFLEIVKPSKEFRLSQILQYFPRVDSLVLEKVAPTMIDCEVPKRIKLFIVNGETKRIDSTKKATVEAEITRNFGN